MIFKLFFFITITARIIYGQLLYDDERTGQLTSFLQNGSTINIPFNISEIRGTSEYEKLVNTIISNGILKLTLAVDRSIMSFSNHSYDNIAYAPASIAAALALVLLGANGKTFNEISNLLGLAGGINIQNKSQIVHEQFGKLLRNLEDSTGYADDRQINFATALFIQNNYPVRNLYKESANSLYRSEVINLNFKDEPDKAQQYMNNWISDKTHDKITELLDEPPPSETKVIIASALYFKAKWEKPFFEGVTRKRPFYPNGHGTKSDFIVEMMSNGGNFPYYKDLTLNCEIMGFPYKGNQSTMYVIVPHNSSKERLKELETKLNPQELERLVNNVRYTSSIILFPKMKIDSTINLKKSLEILGVKSLFNRSEANLALLSPGIGNAIQGLDQVVPYNLESSSVYGSESVLSKNPQVQKSQPEGTEELYIFSRFADLNNCTNNSNQTKNKCRDIINNPNNKQHTINQINNKLGKRITKRAAPINLDSLRQYLNQQRYPNNFENPGLYADKVLHKVYMDITESGTEAAASTAVSLSRDGGRITFIADVPFFFFIRHEETKIVLFWGSVYVPTPNYK